MRRPADCPRGLRRPSHRIAQGSLRQAAEFADVRSTNEDAVYWLTSHRRHIDIGLETVYLPPKCVSGHGYVQQPAAGVDDRPRSVSRAGSSRRMCHRSATLVRHARGSRRRARTAPSAFRLSYFPRLAESTRQWQPARPPILRAASRRPSRVSSILRCASKSPCSANIPTIGRDMRIPDFGFRISDLRLLPAVCPIIPRLSRA